MFQKHKVVVVHDSSFSVCKVVASRFGSDLRKATTNLLHKSRTFPLNGCRLGVQTSRAARELLEIGSRKSSKRAEPYRARV
ncbi:hypothetical protein Hanom_Chr01g00071541 [Helianthus anomalus]